MRSVEELEEENRVLKDTIALLVIEITQLKAENSKLKAGSSKSNKPPSSDGYSKPSVKNSRIKSDRKSGGQVGHEGKTLEISPNPDIVIELKAIPVECDCGGKTILDTENYTVRQVVDIAEPKKIIIEYHQLWGACDTCGKIYKADFPENVTNTVVYGSHLKSLLTYLNQYQLLPLKRTTELMRDLFGVSVSQASVIASTEEAYEKLFEFDAVAKERIINSDVVHFDETGMRVDGHLNWLHVASTKDITLYDIHKKRGKEAMDEIGVLPALTGVAVHDHLKSYYKYKNCSHAECNAHILRYLQRLQVDLRYKWAEEMKTLLLQMKRHVDLSKIFGAMEIERNEIKAYETAYRRILDDAKVEDEIRRTPQLDDKKPKKSESELLSNRMAEYNIETLSFIYDFRIPFDNNQAERDIRMPKAKQKISGAFRTDDGAKIFARVRSAVSTTIKNGKSVIEGLTAAFSGSFNKFIGWQ